MPKNNKLIMVIEDESLLREAIITKLKKSGYETIACSGAKQALDYLETLSKKPNLIWLDFYLGEGLNGLDFMNELKKRKEWLNIPVMVVSNSSSDEKVKLLLQLGAVKYILKAESRLDEIVAQIKELVQNNAKKNTDRRR